MTPEKATLPRQEAAAQLARSRGARPDAALLRRHAWGRVTSFPVAWAGHPPQVTAPPEDARSLVFRFSRTRNAVPPRGWHPDAFLKAPIIAVITGWSPKSGYALEIWEGGERIQAAASVGTPVVPAIVGIAHRYKEDQWPSALKALWAGALKDPMTPPERHAHALSAALCAAIKHDDEDVVVELLKAGACAQSVPGGQRHSALTLVLRRHAGAMSSSKQDAQRDRLLSLLLTHGHIAWDDHQESPLHQAVDLYRPGDVLALLAYAQRKGLPQYPQGDQGKTPLHHMLESPRAGAGGAFDTPIRHCLSQGRPLDLARRTHLGLSAMGMLIQASCFAAVRGMLERQVPPTPDALWAVLEQKDGKLLEALLKAGARPDRSVSGVQGDPVTPLSRPGNPPEMQAMMAAALLERQLSRPTPVAQPRRRL